MLLKSVMDIGKSIRKDVNWKDNKDYFSSVTQEEAKGFFQKIGGRSLKSLDEDDLINLFYGTVALEYKFEIKRGSVTPTIKILKELGERNDTHFETHGNWAGANRGNNPYTPFGHRYGFKTYQELLDHKIAKDKKQIAEKIATDERRKHKKNIKALMHTERLRAKKLRDIQRTDY